MGAASRKKPGVFNLLFTKSVLISCFIFAFQQFAGINAIIYFSSSVFAQAGSEPCIAALYLLHYAVKQNE